nr:permease [Actinopolymorpha pittospori]
MTWAKWWPYAHKVAGVLTTGTYSGTSALTDGGAAPPAPSWLTAWTFGIGYFRSVWMALVAALFIAAASEAFLPRQWMVRVLSGGPRWLGGSMAGGLLGLPSMMCTCCTAPVALSLRRSGVPTSSALAYWLANPTLNPVVLVFMAVALPAQWVGVRIAAGLLLVFLVPPLLARLSTPRVPATTHAGPAGGTLGDAGDVGALIGTTSAVEAQSLGDVRTALRRFAVALGKMAVILVPEYIVVVASMGVLRGWLFPIGGEFGDGGVILLVVLAVAGALFVIPTAGEIPIILGLLQAGVAPGPVGALLVTLPALSLASLLLLRRAFPARLLLAAFASVVVLGVLSGGVLWAIA